MSMADCSFEGHIKSGTQTCRKVQTVKSAWLIFDQISFYTCRPTILSSIFINVDPQTYHLCYVCTFISMATTLVLIPCTDKVLAYEIEKVLELLMRTRINLLGKSMR